MNTIDIQTLQTQPEGQQFDRKSFRIEAKSLAVIAVAFANADGGDIAIGIEDDGRITGINGNDMHLNELLRVPFDFCVPSIQADVKFLDCNDVNGNPNRVMVMHIEPSMKVHSNQSDEAFYRVGDKSKKLNFEMRMQLFYAKGGRYYEDEPVYGATIDDIDLDFVSEYCHKIGFDKDADTYLRTNKGYITTVNGVEKVSGAAILLFGKDPQKFFQRARIRIVRYSGDEERFGREMNVIKDVWFEGRILEMTQKAIDFVETQIKEYTYLGEDARFVTIPQYPQFCWTELIVNAVAHRDYSILGTDIMVKIFDHHYIVESPGILPGMVRIDNIRQMHFSRNPKIVQYLQQYKLVKEFGEGVDRMFREMEQSGNPAPEYKQIEFMVKVRLNSNVKEQGSQTSSQRGSQRNSRTTSGRILNLLKQNSLITREQMSVEIGISDRMIAKYLKDFQEKGILKRVGGKFGGQWVINDVENNTFVGSSQSGPESGPGNSQRGPESGPGNSRSGPESGPETQKVDCKSGPENTAEKILELIRQDQFITSREIAIKLGMARSGISKHLRNLQEMGVLRHIGFNKGGRWEVII
jgi:ATP-dependent DNA helicase RecG